MCVTWDTNVHTIIHHLQSSIAFSVLLINLSFLFFVNHDCDTNLSFSRIVTAGKGGGCVCCEFLHGPIFGVTACIDIIQSIIQYIGKNGVHWSITNIFFWSDRRQNVFPKKKTYYCVRSGMHFLWMFFLNFSQLGHFKLFLQWLLYSNILSTWGKN